MSLATWSTGVDAPRKAAVKPRDLSISANICAGSECQSPSAQATTTSAPAAGAPTELAMASSAFWVTPLARCSSATVQSLRNHRSPTSRWATPSRPTMISSNGTPRSSRLSVSRTPDRLSPTTACSRYSSTKPAPMSPPITGRRPRSAGTGRAAAGYRRAGCADEIGGDLRSACTSRNTPSCPTTRSSSNYKGR